MDPLPPSVPEHSALFLPASHAPTPVPHSSAAPLRVSVVIPTYRRPRLLRRCLSALGRQTLPLELYEVIVVDDAPSDDTRDAVAAAATAQPWLSIRYIPAEGPHGPAAARNRGWRAARAPLIAFTDDDCVPLSGWLAEGCDIFRIPGISGAWGRIIVPLPARPTDHALNTKGLEEAPCATANCFYTKAALTAVGGLDERFTAAWREDSDLEFSLRERGFQIVPSNRASVVHPVRAVPWGISLRQQKNDFFDALLYQKHPVYFRSLLSMRAPWHYYASAGALCVGIVTAAMQLWVWAAAAFLIWAGIALRFGLYRLRHTTRKLSHVIEMAVTSALIPPLTLCWRLRGAIRHGVLWW